MPGYDSKSSKSRNKGVGIKERNAIYDLQKKFQQKGAGGASENEQNDSGNDTVDALSTIQAILPKVTDNADSGAADLSCVPGIQGGFLSKIETLLNATGRGNEKGMVPSIITDSDTIKKEKDQLSKFIGPTKGHRNGRVPDFLMQPEIKTTYQGYNDMVDHCDKYIDSHNPWTTSGKQRLAIIKAARWQAAQERKIIEDYANEDNPGYFNPYDSATFDEYLVKAAATGFTYTGGKIEQNDQKVVAESLAGRNGISIEDANYIVSQMETVRDLEMFLGGTDTITSEQLDKLASQVSDKRRMQEGGNFEQRKKKKNEEYESYYIEALEYAPKLVPGFKPNESKKENVGRFAMTFLEQSHDKDAVTRNATRLINLLGDNDEAAMNEWSKALSEWASIDISMFDDRSPKRMMREYSKLHKYINIGFTLKNDIMNALKDSGYEIDGYQKADIIALADFYNGMAGYMSNIMQAYTSDQSLLADTEKFGDIFNVARKADLAKKGITDTDEDEDEDEITFDSSMSFMNPEVSDYAMDYKHKGTYGQMFGTNLAFAIGNVFASNKKAIDILRDDCGFAGDLKALRNIKINKKKK